MVFAEKRKGRGVLPEYLHLAVAVRDPGLPQEVHDPPLTTHDRVPVSMRYRKIVFYVHFFVCV